METELNVPWDSKWKEIPEFPGYWVSQNGDIFSMPWRRLINTYTTRHHYRIVRLYGQKPHIRSVDKLIRQAFPTRRNYHDN